MAIGEPATAPDPASVVPYACLSRRSRMFAERGLGPSQPFFAASMTVARAELFDGYRLRRVGIRIEEQGVVRARRPNFFLKALS